MYIVRMGGVSKPPFSSGNYSYSAPTRASPGPGRPRFDISEQQLMYLHSMGFTWVDIANLLGVSRMTIFRRRREFGQVESVGDTIDGVFHFVPPPPPPFPT